MNRILRMLDEDEIVLSWHIDNTPFERIRSRSLYDFNRINEPVVLPGSIAYQRLRDMEQEYLKKQPSQYSSTRNLSSRERPKRLSQQHDRLPPSNSNGEDNKISAARLRAQAEYEAELAALDAKRKARESTNYQSELNSSEVMLKRIVTE